MTGWARKSQSALGRAAHSDYIGSMTFLVVLIGLALAAVVGILATGVLGMARGGEFNRKYGNKLMQARVVAQGVALLLILVLLMVTGR